MKFIYLAMIAALAQQPSSVEIRCELQKTLYCDKEPARVVLIGRRDSGSYTEIVVKMGSESRSFKQDGYPGDFSLSDSELTFYLTTKEGKKYCTLRCGGDGVKMECNKKEE